VFGPQYREVPMVQCCYLRLIEAFRNAHDCRVNKSNVGVCIAVTDLCYSCVIGQAKVLDLVGTIQYILEQRQEDSHVHSTGYQLFDFN